MSSARHRGHLLPETARVLRDMRPRPGDLRSLAPLLRHGPTLAAAGSRQHGEPARG